jgi:prefoldin beta subunit
MQQSLQNFAVQRQQFQMQQSEIDSALAEIEKSSKAYKIIGNIMVAVNNEELKKELQEKQQMLTIGISTIEKQETKLREKAEEIQKEVLKGIEKKQETKKKSSN